MPLVEFAGASGVGKTTLMNQILAHEKLKAWRVIRAPTPVSRKNFSDIEDMLTGTMLTLWKAKRRNISASPETDDLRNHALSIAAWHLRWDQNFLEHQVGSFNVIDEHFLQMFTSELGWLAKSHPEESKSFLKNRNFILCIDEPLNILRKVRHRQVVGPQRLHLSTWDDAKILDVSKGHQTDLLAFLREYEHFGYRWMIIDMSKGLDVAMLQCAAYLLGLINIHKTTASETEHSP